MPDGLKHAAKSLAELGAYIYNLTEITCWFMPNRILLTKYIEKPEQGASPLQVLIFETDSFQRYFVKCAKKNRANDHPNDVRQLANEYICARIANKLGLCCPVGKICELSESLNHQVQSLGIIDGPYFGSKEVPHKGSFESNEFSIQQCMNKESFPLLILFESYVCNSDMQDRNVLMGKDQNLWVIDHANSFGGSWVYSPTVSCHDPLVGKGDSFKSAKLLVNEASKTLANRSNLFEVFRHEVNNEFINLIVDETPPEWIGDSQKIALKNILQCRLRNLEQLIEL